MPDQKDAIAATFVEPRGMIRSVVSSVASQQVMKVVSGVAVSASTAGGSDSASPLKSGQIAYLAVFGEELVMYRAKRGAFKPKPTDEILASAPRTDIASAKVEKGRIAGVLEIAFTGGEQWAFDVPKVHLGGANEIATALS